MCGIIGYLGDQDGVTLVLEGLAKLEYRGYDSAGLAAVVPQGLFIKKTLGPVKELADSLRDQEIDSSLVIGHTRWATHGVPTEINAHPHTDQDGLCAVVHNGIIENFKELRQELTLQGVLFVSDTDSEIIAQLFALYYKDSHDLIRSFCQTLLRLRGSVGCALVHKDHPDLLLCASQESPLILGLGKQETFIASDSRAFVKYTRHSQILASGEFAIIAQGKKPEVYNLELKKISKDVRQITCNDDPSNKSGYSYFMLKEIYDQPEVLEGLIQKHMDEEGYILPEFISDLPIKNFKEITIVACGSSYHAGYLAKYVIESLVSIPVHVEVASEFRYRRPYIGKDTLGILISQSGETADTLSALKELRRRNVRSLLGICNVPESAIALGVDHCLFLEAGIEIGVASTKAFTSQLLLLILFGLKLASLHGALTHQEQRSFGQGLQSLPDLCRKLLANDALHSWAQGYVGEDKFLFLGRRLMYPIVMEAALKLKEIAYIEANAYPGGEMKHGPIALISRGTPVVAFCGDDIVYEKMIGNMMEVKARHAHVIAIAPEARKDVAAVSDQQIYIPNSHFLAAPVLYTIAGQVMAYAMGLAKGTNIDCPRNLAKSVTVE
ncbi:Glucosamine--fructose-6-phosphate aminotransferase [isomerizing],glucosamine--fructose-6-phosphate aminotransferase,Predicted phosphosugar isomerases,glutamine-fructose-6-phosphate transaminase (isomerizing),SIS domain [Chlamydia serpentis]|uniref:Glutamine--fructose-6-phosphate aminotransferase [isomerizing] n=1 Tax=Chlamydia serpentis TaxID=1967782 RepID=A0A2R8FCC8_9CHLA|nr:glutamine--fructose-6-phosphate transaminase (isomerizing) [Chlamydia serpentis]SPN74075.1 Glucosamine--fructose-6-phosphate aminotransferase [isomerizing],glucosamine--fructose-6-phosphate aminotransferase,Predicted phosphosugar isomerases,glutamine-fructose-6-phosphate transaminase (isomerizing),SIS domain [Chlamydia serpentis]